MPGFFLLYILSFILFASARQVHDLSYEARGRLICPLGPYRKARVVLLDKKAEKESESGKDDIIYDEVEADVFGNFRVHARAHAYKKPSMAPFLTIYHSCDTGDVRHLTIRKMTFQLPYIYTNSGFFHRVFDMGTVNLETHIIGEEAFEPLLLEKGIYKNLMVNKTM